MSKFLLLICCLMSLSKSDNVLYIKSDSVKSSDCPGTLCDTLNNYTNYKNHSTLNFLPGNHTLRVTLNFTDVENLSLIAIDRELVSIHCFGQARLLFDDISNLTLDGIQFVGCGVVLEKKPAIKFNRCFGSVISVRVAGSPAGAMCIDNSRLSFTNLTVENTKINYTLSTSDSFSAIKANKSRIHLTGTTTISDNNANPDQSVSMDCGYGSYAYKNIESVTLKVINTTLTVTGTLIVTNNIGPSGTMNFENSHFTANGTSFFSQNTVCIEGALSLVKSNASLSTLTRFINNTGSLYYYPGLIPVSGISLRQSNLHIEGTVFFMGNEADISTIEAYSSNITISGELVDENNSASYAGSILRAETNMVVNGTVRFSNNNHEDAVVRIESSNFTSNGEIGFIKNKGESPCIARYSGHFSFNGVTVFMNNPGILAAYIESTFSLNGDSTFIMNNVRDFSTGGGIVLVKSALYLSGNYSFERNRLTDIDGGAIYADQSTIEFRGHGTFKNNSARNGGAIYLQNNSTMLFHPGVSVEFTGNSATKGGALFVFSSIRSLNCNDSADAKGSTSSCFIQHNATNGNHKFAFKNNVATEGGSIVHFKFVEDIDINRYSNSTALEVLTHPSLDSNSIPFVASDSFQLCFCENNEPNCDVMKKRFMHTQRGERISVSIRAVTLMQSSDIYIRSYLKSFSRSNAKSLDGDIQYLNDGCTDLEYRVFSRDSEEQVIICADESCEEASDAKLVLQIHFEECPMGFTANGTECVCDQDILMNSTEECDIDKKTIAKTNQNFWIGSQNGSDLKFFTNCPLDYCTRPPVDVNPLLPDTQCRNNRSGILCGACKDNMSLILGSSKCKDCPNNFTLFLIIPFALLGIVLVAFLFVFQLTVSSGTIHGLILYASIVKANSATLSLQNIKVVTVFVAWLNLDFGIETCFHKGMDQFSKTGWQFVFPIYLWLLVGMVIIICRYSACASRFFSKSNPVEVLATVILLSYTKLLQNIISILTYAQASYPPPSRAVWKYDGNVIFGQGGHAVLITVSIFVLLFLFVPFTLVLIFEPLLQMNRHISKLLNRLRLTPFINAYQAPYKSHSRYWVGFCLFLRCLVLVVVGSAGNETAGLLVTSSLSVLLVSIIGMTGGIYTKRWLDVLEISYLLNLGLLTVATYHLKLAFSPGETGRIHGEYAIEYISIIVAIIIFLVIVIKQSYGRLMKLPLFRRRMDNLKQKVKTRKEINMESPVVKKKERESSATFQDLFLSSDEYALVKLREPMLDYSCKQ